MDDSKIYCIKCNDYAIIHNFQVKKNGRLSKKCIYCKNDKYNKLDIKKKECNIT